ncbi:MAG: class I SAM-dependent methyltransferase [Elusimicrobia bacterium]|nr:class I SAM-dependent methyltransferase [Elusimicrobiota bacterium]
MRRMSGQKTGAAFFYAQKEAAIYDETVELTQPLYCLLHTTMLDLLRYHFDAWDGDRAGQVRGAILDAGCGTGAEGMAVLTAFPNIHLVAVDFSQRMLDKFRSKLVSRFGPSNFKERCSIVRADLLGQKATADAMHDLIANRYGSVAYRAVVTAFTLHHLTYNQKKLLYHRFYDVLEPGGLFLNGDLFSYRSSLLAQCSHRHGERWIVKQFTHPDPDLKPKAAALGERRGELLKLWLNHLRIYNKPLPVEDFQGEAALLNDIGFAQVGCPFRYFQAGILWARK